ncbi:hypothetical protein [Riemerella anatipestifer]|uniref:hypothetical protein n=1 Tax=Riemerella anatipestifer TaxID=34085 RepID=UPI00236423DB|nr:hypothetical protein [Riemerella anatipestifer]MDD1525573.1 hypothetical protein [Riemerella anatipestifer]
MNKALIIINLINYLAVRLKEVDDFFLYNHKNMGLKKVFVEADLAHKEEFYKEVNEKLAEVANLLGDALNGIDATTEEDIAITTPIFKIINKN